MPHTATGMTAQRLHNRRQAPSAPPAATVPNSSGLTRLQMELNTVSRNRNELRQRLNNTTSSLETMQQSSLGREQDLETLKSQLQRALEEQTTTTQSLRSQYEMVPKSNLEAKEQELKNAENHWAQVIQEYEADISSLKQQLGNAVKNGANKQQAFNTFTHEVKTIASNRNAAREELERVRGQMNKFADEVEARVKNTLAARFEKEKQITSNIARTSQRTITLLKEQLKKAESQQATAGVSTRRSTELESQVEALQAQLRDQQDRYDQIMEQLDAKDQNLKKRQNNITNKNTQIANLAQQLRTLQGESTAASELVGQPPQQTILRASGRGLLTAGAVLGKVVWNGGQFVARQLAAQPFSSSATNGLESQVSGTYPQPRNQDVAQAQTQVPSQFKFKQRGKMKTVYAPMRNGKFVCNEPGKFLHVERDNTGTIQGRKCMTEAQVGAVGYVGYDLATSYANYTGAYALTKKTK